jgi:hypothetical protein
MIYRAAGAPTTSGSGTRAPAALDWLGASNLNTCRQPQGIDAAFDRHEARVGVAVIALVCYNTDTVAILPRASRALTSTNPETRRQGLLHTVWPNGQVDDLTPQPAPPPHRGPLPYQRRVRSSRYSRGDRALDMSARYGSRRIAGSSQ